MRPLMRSDGRPVMSDIGKPRIGDADEDCCCDGGECPCPCQEYNVKICGFACAGAQFQDGVPVDPQKIRGCQHISGNIYSSSHFNEDGSGSTGFLEAAIGGPPWTATFICSESFFETNSFEHDIVRFMFTNPSTDVCPPLDGW